LQKESKSGKLIKRGIYMNININLWSFILSLCCFPLFFLATVSENLVRFFNETIGIHLLSIVLGITLAAFILGIIGLKDVREWKAMARSLFTIILTLGFSGLLMIILFFGNLLN